MAHSSCFLKLLVVLPLVSAVSVFTLSTEFSNPAEKSHTGSKAGGTMLFVDGTNLMTHDPSQVQILIGKQECVFDHFLMRENYIECTTPAPTDPAALSNLPITVKFNGTPASINPSANPTFSYSLSKTAQIYAVAPAQQSPFNSISFYGNWRTEGDNSLYMEIRAANRHMEMLPDYSTYTASGTSFIATALGDNVAGEGDPTVRLAASFGYGEFLWGAKQYTLAGQSYLFKTIAEVNSASFHSGSTAGGLEVTLGGAGFPSDTAKVTVSVEGNPCAVSSVAYDSVRCVTSGRTSTEAGPAYEGMAGLRHHRWYKKTLSQKDALVDSEADDIDIVPLAEGFPPSNDRVDDTYVERWVGFFKAPRTGDYTFFVSSDDNCQVWLSTDKTSANKVKIIDFSGYTAYRDMLSRDNTRSQAISLSAGSLYYIEIWHQQWSGATHFSLGVRIPSSGTPAANNMPSVQQLSIRPSQLIREVQRVTFSRLPTGGKVAFTYKGKTSDTVNWPSSGAAWACDDILKAMKGFDISSLNCAMNSTAGLSYDFTFTYAWTDIRGLIGTVASGVLPSGVSASTTQPVKASKPLGGSYKVQWRNIVSESIPLTTSAGTLQYQLNTNFTVLDSKLLVSGSASVDAVRFLFVFGDSLNPTGTVPLISASSLVTGGPDDSAPIVEVTEYIPGSIDQFWWSVPSEFFRTIENYPNFHVEVEGQPAICRGNCAFQYSASSPAIASVTYAATVSMTGSNLPAACDMLSVTIGGANCPVTACSTTTVTCTQGAGVVGTFKPQVLVAGSGLAVLDPALPSTTIALAVTSVSPAVGSVGGGTLLTVLGTGFVPQASLPGYTQTVKVGSSPCEVQTSIGNSITCITSPQQTTSVVTVTVNASSAASSGFTYDLASSPTITAVSPTYASTIVKTTLTVTGTNFNPSAAGSVTVFVGDVECYVTSSTATSVVCNLPGGPTGDWLMVVKVPGKGNAVKEHYPLVFELASVSPSAGSTEGGTLLTITGRGLSTRASQLLVMFNDQTHMCVVEGTPTETQMQCRTPPMGTLTVDTANDVILLGRLQEEAKCTSACTFTYSAAATPSVTALTPSSAPAGTALIITGTGFSTAAGVASVKFGAAVATITSVTSTAVSVVVPNQTAGDYRVTVTFDDKGAAAGNFTFTQTLSVASVSPLTGSQAGTDVTISGTGFGSTAAVLFGSTQCKATSTTASSIACRLASSTAATAQSLKITQGTSVFTCTDNSQCGFTFASSLTPTISSATVSGSSVSIVGTGLTTVAGDVRVRIGGVQCSSVASATLTSIVATCTPPSGSQPIEVFLAGKGYATGSVTISTTFAASGATGEGSFAGGSSINLAGSGLGPNTAVTVCGYPCDVTAAAYSSLSCVSPLLPSDFSQQQYQLADTNGEVGGGYSSSAAATGFPQSAMFDGNYSTYYTSNEAGCYVQYDAGTGRKLLLSGVSLYPAEDSISTYRSFVSTNLTKSDDGVTWSQVYNYDVTFAGWNYWTVPVNQGPEDSYPVFKSRYYRFVFPAASKCRVAEVKLLGVVTQSDAAETLSCPVLAFDNGAGTGVPAGTFTYKKTLTPTITSVTPTTGTILGGTVLTFSGQSLAGVNGVSIDGVACTVGSVSATSFTCTTGRRSALQPPSIVVTTASGLAVLTGVNFLYADRWSSSTTWGGEVPPKAGETVQIPVGMTILLDVPTPELMLLLIEGALIVEDVAGITLDAHYIFIKEGLFQVGTRAAPFQHEFTLTLHGRRESPMMPIYGNKVLAVHNGVLDLHGIPRPVTWTSLVNTISPGATTFTVQDVTDWKVGETVVVASTSFHHEEAETRVITAVVGGTQFTVDAPFQYKHYAATEHYGSDTIEMRAEVGLLSRNVKIRGSEEGLDQEHGAHVMAFAPGDDKVVARISYIEIFNAGQAYSIGAYPFHFHMIGAVRNSFIVGNAIHHTFNRAVTIHGISYLRVIDNVCFHTKGHTIFLEDGAETKNRIEHNLIVSVRRSWSRLNTDTTPAGIWVTNPNNYIIGNHVAGSDAYGIWYDFKPNPTGPSATTLVCPLGTPLGEFRGNAAHSNGKYGFRLFHGHVPRTFPCLPATNPGAVDPWADNPPITAIYSDFTGYKNKRNGAIADRVGDVRFQNFKVADNLLAGIEFTYTMDTKPFTIPFVSNALIIGLSGNDEPEVDHSGSIGLIAPQSDGFIAEDVAFYNFDDSMFTLGDESHSPPCTSRDYGGRHNRLRRLSFVNANKRVHWETPRTSFFEIEDDSMTGNAGAYVAAFWPHLLWEPHCVLDLATYNGIVCDGTKVLRRVHMLDLQPAQTFQLMQITVRRAAGDNIPLATPAAGRFLAENADYWWASIDPKFGASHNAMPKAWPIPMIMGTEYLLHWGTTPMDWTSMTIRLDTFDDPSLWVVLRFNFTDHREMFEVRRGTLPPGTNTTAPGFVDPRLLPKNAVLAPTSPAGASNFDNITAMEFRTVMTGQPVTLERSGPLSVTAYRCFGDHCTISTTKENVTLETFERVWSNPQSWPSGAVPVDGERVEILPEWTMRLDTQTAILSFLEVNGILVLDNTTSVTLNAMMIHVRKGKILSGSAEFPLLPNLTHQIVIHGTFDSLSYAFDPNIEVGNKAFIVTGEVKLFGARRKSWVSLVQNARPGDTTLFVQRTNWRAGDEIVLTSGSFFPNETETARIASIQGTYDLLTGADDLTSFATDSLWTQKEATRAWGAYSTQVYADTYQSVDPKTVSKVTLAQPIKFYHSGSVLAVGGDIMDMRSEVGVLTSNVVIRGTENGWACNFVVADFVDYNVLNSNPVLRSGTVTLDSIAIDYCGQNSTLRTGLRFESTTLPSVVSNSIVKRSQTYSVNIQNSKNVKLLRNTFFYSVRFGVFIEKSRDLLLDGNLMINATQRLTIALPFDKPTCFVVCPGDRMSCPNIVLSNNVAAGYAFLGFSDGGSPCGSTPTFYNNRAHSGLLGWVTANIGSTCVEMTGFTTFFNMETAVAGSMDAMELRLSGLRVAESFNGYAGNMGGERDSGNAVSIKDSLFVGSTAHSVCSGECWTPQCSNRRGVVLSSYQANAKQFITNAKLKLPVYNISMEEVFNADFKYESITFYNFNTTDTCRANRTAIASNELCPDYTPMHTFAKTKLVNVANDSIFYMADPDPQWQSLMFCGEFPCTGLKNAIVRDADGGLTGSSMGGYLLPNNPGIAYREPCTFINRSNGFLCPKSQIFDFDYGILMFENLDIDSRDVTISPVYITSTDTILTPASDHFNNKLNSFMSHVWDGFYLGTNRMGRFPTAIGLNRKFNITFTATVPLKMRYQLQGAAKSTDSVLLTVNYKEPYSVKVKVNGTDVAGLPYGKFVELSSPSGTNRWLHTERMIQFVIRGGDIVELGKVDSIQVSIRMNMTTEEFFASNGQTEFVDRLAAVLGIPSYRIRVVDIRSGSTIVDFYINGDEDLAAKRPANSSFSSALQEDLSKVNSLLQSLAQNNSLALNAPVLSVESSLSTGTGSLFPGGGTTTVTPPAQNNAETAAGTGSSGDSEVDWWVYLLAAVGGVMVMSVVTGGVLALRAFFKLRRPREPVSIDISNSMGLEKVSAENIEVIKIQDLDSPSWFPVNDQGSTQHYTEVRGSSKPGSHPPPKSVRW